MNTLMLMCKVVKLWKMPQEKWLKMPVQLVSVEVWRGTL